MTIETGDQGRIYLSKDLWDRHGERFRVVDLPSRIVLVPFNDAPLQAVRESAGSVFERTDLDDLREDARSVIAKETRRETTEGFNS